MQIKGAFAASRATANRGVTKTHNTRATGNARHTRNAKIPTESARHMIN